MQSDEPGQRTEGVMQADAEVVTGGSGVVATTGSGKGKASLKLMKTRIPYISVSLFPDTMESVD